MRLGKVYHTPYHVSRVSRLGRHSCKHRRGSQTPDCRHRSWDHHLKTKEQETVVSLITPKYTAIEIEVLLQCVPNWDSVSVGN